MQTNEITVTNQNLPTTIDDLARFVLIGREKLSSVRAEIRAIDKVGLAEEVRQQKLAEAQDIADAVLDAEVRIGELMTEVPKASGQRTDIEPRLTGEPRLEDDEIEKNAGYGDDDPFAIFEDPRVKAKEKKAKKSKQKTKKETFTELGLNRMQVQRFEALAKHPELVEQAKAEAREKDNIVTRNDVLKKVKAEAKKKEILEAEKSIHEQASEEFKPVLYIDDCTSHIPTEEYDLLLTDPPYSTDVDNIEEFVDDWLFDALNNVKDTGFAYIFIGAYPEEVKAYLNAKIPDHIKLCEILIWTYKNTLGNNPKDRYKQNYQMCLFYRGVNAPMLDCPLTNEQWAVQEINAPDGRQGDRYHAWQKPMEIAERFVRHSTKPGMLVYDPFACTGTFLLAATKLGRRAYGFEINPDNASIAFKRGCVQGE